MKGIGLRSPNGPNVDVFWAGPTSWPIRKCGRAEQHTLKSNIEPVRATCTKRRDREGEGSMGGPTKPDAPHGATGGVPELDAAA